MIERLEISFRDQFVSRRDQWMIVQSLNNRTVFKTKQIEYSGIRIRIRALYNKEGQEILNGIIKTQQTKISFFTKSC